MSGVLSTTGQQRVSVTAVVDGLPTDVAMAALVDAHRLLSQQHDCILCGQKASALCLDCNDTFCHSCQSLHTKQSISRGHALRDLTSLTPETLAAGKHATCAEHSDEACKVYCPTHGAALCLLCATTTHRQCQNVVSLQARQREIMAELQELSSLLKDGERKLNLSVDQLDQHIKHTNQRLDQALHDIQTTYDRLEKVLKDCRHREMDEVRKAAADVIQDANDVKSELQQRQGKMSAHQTITQRSQQHGQESTAADVHAQLKDRVTDLVRNATTPLDKVVRSFTFTFDTEVLKRIEHDLSHIGKVTFAPVTDVEMLISNPTQKMQEKQVAPTGFQFHGTKHGKRITLSNNDTTAEKTTDDWDDGFVFSKEPMETQMLYEVRVDKTSRTVGSGLGVVTVHPESFTMTTKVFWLQHANAACLNSGGVTRIWGKDGQHDSLKKLVTVGVGSRVGLALDSNRNLHFYLDGRDEGVVVPTVPTPCYFVFDLVAKCVKVTSLPPKRIQLP